MARPLATDRFVLAPRGATFVAFLNAGYTADEAEELTQQSLANPERLLEDCRLQKPRLMKLA